jgi:hypothetical protein
MNGLNRVLLIHMGSSFGVNAIGGDGVMAMNVFWNGDSSQCFS